MASNYSPKPENVQLAFNPAIPAAAAQGSPHYSAPQTSRPTPPPEQKVRQGGSSQGPIHMSYQSKYGELLNVIEDLGREIKPTYAGSKMAQERLKKGIMHARALVRECLAEVEKSARQ